MRYLEAQPSGSGEGTVRADQLGPLERPRDALDEEAHVDDALALGRSTVRLHRMVQSNRESESKKAKRKESITGESSSA